MAARPGDNRTAAPDDIITGVDDIIAVVSEVCRDKGVECYPFLIDWYNSCVADVFNLPYHRDTLAVLLISVPSMFEMLFKPFLQSDAYNQSDKIDPIDKCLKNHFLAIKERFPANQVDIMQDFELLPSRRPKILVQTAGHVAGAARYYQRKDVNPDPWGEGKKIYGVSVHPKYGGWFALRGALIFRDVLAPGLEKKEPPDCVPTREMRIELLEKFNYHWKDWEGSHRDVCNCEVLERYSEDQKAYFGTEPSKRYEIISTMLTHTAY